MYQWFLKKKKRVPSIFDIVRAENLCPVLVGGGAGDIKKAHKEKLWFYLSLLKSNLYMKKKGILSITNTANTLIAVVTQFMQLLKNL